MLWQIYALDMRLFYAFAFCLLGTAERLSFMLLPVIRREKKISLFYCFHLCFWFTFFTLSHNGDVLLDFRSRLCVMRARVLLLFWSSSAHAQSQSQSPENMSCDVTGGVELLVWCIKYFYQLWQKQRLTRTYLCSVARLLTFYNRELSREWCFLFVMHLWFMKKRPFIVNRL